MNSEPRFAVFLANLFGYGFAFVILLMFLRNWLPFAIASAPFVIAASALILFLIARIFSADMNRKHGEIDFFLRYRLPNMKGFLPGPSKADFWPLFCALLILLSLAAYFQKFPLFPEYRSVDFAQHVRLVNEYSQGDIPPIQRQVLYYGVEYLLSLFVIALPDQSLFVVRQAMVLFAAISPFLFFRAVLSLFKSTRLASLASLVWSLSAAIWFTMPFNVGLYPNFYGVLATLLLIVASVDFIKKKVGVSSLFLLALALVNALLSHYTILFLFAPLILSLLVYSRKEKVFRRGVLLSAILSAPLLVGFFLFQGILSTLLSFLGGESSLPAPTYLSSLIPLPVLSYAVATVNNDWFSLVTLFSLPPYVYRCLKTKNALMLLPLSLLIEIVLLSPFGTAAWRFSFVALVPFLMITAYSISIPYEKSFFTLRKIVTAKSALKQIGLMALLVSPVFYPSWGAQMLDNAMTDTTLVANQQAADYEAMKWIKANLRDNVTLLSISNRDFAYSALAGSNTILYAPDLRLNGAALAWNDPKQMGLYAAQNRIRYLIVTNTITELLGSCPLPANFTATFRANATVMKAGHAVQFDVSTSFAKDLPGVLVLDDSYAPFYAVNGMASIVVKIFGGEHQAFVAFGSINTQRIKVGEGEGSNPFPASVGIAPNYCWPFQSFNPYTLGRVATVYQDDYVKIFRLGG